MSIISAPLSRSDVVIPEMLKGLTDEELVERCKRELPGNMQSYEILVERHMPSVYRLVYRMVGNREEAEDITQEVFVKTYMNFHAFKQLSSFSTWLYRIATNCTLDALTKIKRHSSMIISITPYVSPVKVKEDEVLRPYFASVAGPEEILLQRELRECLRRVLQTLEPEEALLLVMRDFNDLSYNEIANALGVSVGAVKMRIHRARLAFQEAYNKQSRNNDLTYSFTLSTKTRV